MARKRTADKQHRWLSQVEVTGIVFSEPVLAEAAPAGFPNLDKRVLARFYKAREIWNLPKGMLKDDGQGEWIRFILEEILRLKSAEDWLVGAALPAALVVRLPEQQETLRPDRVLVDDGAPVMMVLEVPRGQSLDRPWLQKVGRWKASPTTKLERILRESKVELGLVTNGEAWRLVVASPSETASWITWTANTWADSPITLAAFRDLLGEERFFAGAREDVLLELVRRSRKRQLDVADQLGAQVREALGLLVHELDRVDAAQGGRLLGDYSEAEVFEAVVAFIMRLLFLLFAEENGLLPHGTVAYDRAYGILHLLTELESQHRLAPETLKHSYSAYARVLATTRLIHAGSVDPDIRIAAHGGRLFDPERYPMLEGRLKDGAWPTESPEPPRVSDAVVRGVLRSLKYAKSDGAKQLVSYRTLAVEQIGHMYEGLLDRRVARAPEDDVLFLLQGSGKVKEPEPLRGSEIEGLTTAELLKLIAKRTGRTKKTLQTLLEKPEKYVQPRDAGTSDAGLLTKLAPVHRFIVDRGLVRPGGMYVTHGKDRRSQGAHYTPPTLTEPIVRRTLEHQVYVNVPEKPGLLAEPRRVKTPEALLDLKVCDPAMGSGAFLVQVVRYLSERLVDAWEVRANAHPKVVLTMPYGVPSEGAEDEAILPESREDRLLWAKRYVAERCVYGVDVNRHAVEMAKLSLWISTASVDRPFTFLDHALKQGDSLVGLTKAQIQAFSWKQLRRDWGPLFEGVTGSVADAQGYRTLLHELADHDYQGKSEHLQAAEDALGRVRLIGDAIIASFYSSDNAADRKAVGTRYRALLALDLPEMEQLRDEVATVLHADGIHLHPFHWEIEFPEVFKGDDQGFDAVVGNPPFLNAIEARSARSERTKELFKITYQPFAKGAYDYCLMFWAKTTLSLLRRYGRYGLLSPTTLLSSTKPWQSWMHDAFRPDALLLFPVDQFKDARIRTTGIVGGVGTSDSVLVLDSDEVPQRRTQRTWPLAPDGWYAITRPETAFGAPRAPVALLEQCAVVVAGCTTGVAYELKPLVLDVAQRNRPDIGPKLVTTGAIDRFVCKWGAMRIRYLKGDYDFPRWPGVGALPSVARARDRQDRRKILVGGLTAVVEAWLDQTADAAGIVQTWVLTADRTRPDAWMWALMGVLNCATFSRIYMRRFGAAAMSGNQTTIKKKSLQRMALPAVLSTGSWSDDVPTLTFGQVWDQAGVPMQRAVLLASIARRLQVSQDLDADRWRCLDKALHGVAAALYGYTADEATETYLWWCRRAREVPCPLDWKSRLLHQIVDDSGPPKQLGQPDLL